MTPARYLVRHQADLVRFLQQLIRLNTVNPPGHHYGEITEILVATLRDIGLEARRVTVPRSVQKKTQPELLDYPRYNVLARWDTGAKKTVHFNAHFDVVPVSGRWRHGDPFNPAIEKGWMYGRGTSDMKGAIASIVFGLKALKATGTKPNFNVEVSFCADEETDSTLGTGWVTQREKLTADYAIVGEGGEGDAVCCGHNGVVWLNVHVHGKAAHGSTPLRGVNALEKMSALVLALDEYKRVLARKKFKSAGRPRDGADDEPRRGLRRRRGRQGQHRARRRQLHHRPSRAAGRERRRRRARPAGVPHQGRAPDSAVPDHDREDLAQPLVLPRSRDAFRRALKASVTRVRRRPAHFTVSTGFNDMHFFANERRLPTLGYGPGGQNYHAIDERAKIKDLVEAATIYADLLTTFAG
ncbi:MAG: M20/M25/M40 family metallo-hydrolase [Lacunisphaera sp.]